MEEQKYQRKFSKLELAYNTYNIILQRVVDFELDVEFYLAKAKTFKKNSNEHNANMQEHYNAKNSLNNNLLTIKVLEKQIENLEAEAEK